MRTFRQNGAWPVLLRPGAKAMPSVLVDPDERTATAYISSTAGTIASACSPVPSGFAARGADVMNRPGDDVRADQ